MIVSWAHSRRTVTAVVTAIDLKGEQSTLGGKCHTSSLVQYPHSPNIFKHYYLLYHQSESKNGSWRAGELEDWNTERAEVLKGGRARGQAKDPELWR